MSNQYDTNMPTKFTIQFKVCVYVMIMNDKEENAHGWKPKNVFIRGCGQLEDNA